MLVSAICLFTPLPSAAAGWSVEGFLGTSHNADSTLTVHQEGQPDIQLKASWDTRPLSNAPYYALRLTQWWDHWGMQLGLLHNKIYLNNPTAEIEKFEITFGYNLVSLGPAWRSGGWSLFAGVGPAITNPSSIIRGQEQPHSGGFLDTGYHLDGVHAQAGVNRRFPISDNIFFSADLRLSAAWANVPVVNGDADVPNYAAHLLLGIGWGAARSR